MNSNQKKLKQMIRDQELAISDEELFTSSAYQKYLTSMAKAATGRYRQGLQALMEWDARADAGIAHTDNYKIHINAANEITQSFPSRYLRSESLVGFNGHETAHLLFSDFTALGLYLGNIEKGAFYPSNPSFTEFSYQTNCEEILEAMDSKDKATCLTLASCASHINNILEDIYIEARMCVSHPGTFRRGIELNNLRMCELMPSIQSQIEKKYSDFAIMANLLLQYCRAGTINNLSGYKGPYLDYLEDCMPYVDDAIYSDETKDRFHASNHIVAILWEYIKPLIEETKERMKQHSESDASQMLEELLGNQIHGATPLPSGKGGTMPKQAEEGKKEQKANPLPCTPPAMRQENTQAAQDVVAEEGNRIALAKTNTILDENNPGITYNHQYLGTGYEKSANELFRILNGIATEKAETQYQQEMTEELQKAANDIHYGNAHTGVHVTINRIAYVPDSLKQSYHAVTPMLIRASKRLQKSIAPLLKEESEGGKLKNLQFGKRLDTRAMHHEDGTFFTRTRLPSEEQKLAVGLLVDESGSMSWGDRITHAKKTAIVLYDFCQSLQVPITIYGHSTGGRGVELYSYAEFDSIDTSDRYRLMDMSARGGNRDGAALRFVAEHLAKRPEKQKLLIIISDGQPADTGYYGTEAEADLRGIKKEYSKKGIKLFAAAIGDDKENIKRIYQDGFLDITKLEDLPKNMTLLVKQYLK
ncbi:MAG: vWA domain-containing protein [Lachnospiraceae bacterium]